MIDYDKLKNDLTQDALGAFYGGGFGGALIESFDIDNADEDELIDIALQKGIDLDRYKKSE